MVDKVDVALAEVAEAIHWLKTKDFFFSYQDLSANSIDSPTFQKKRKILAPILQNTSKIPSLTEENGLH